MSETRNASPSACVRSPGRLSRMSAAGQRLRGGGGDLVGGGLRVPRNDRQARELRLGDEDPVERIAVVERELLGGPGVLGRDRERFEPVGCETPDDVVDGRPELAEILLRRDLPERGGADGGGRLGVGGGRGGDVRQRGVLLEPPEQRRRGG